MRCFVYKCTLNTCPIPWCDVRTSKYIPIAPILCASTDVFLRTDDVSHISNDHHQHHHWQRFFQKRKISSGLCWHSEKKMETELIIYIIYREVVKSRRTHSTHSTLIQKLMQPEEKENGTKNLVAEQACPHTQTNQINQSQNSSFDSFDSFDSVVQSYLFA